MEYKGDIMNEETRKINDSSSDIHGIDDDIYQKTYLESQSALKSANEHSSNTVNAIINDLKNYLSSLENKVDSEGNKLINYPSNFEKVSDAMSRDDLFNTNKDNNQWSKTLLSNQFDANFENGRYQHVLNDDDKLQKALAEIHLLDSKLKTTTRKANTINQSILSMNEFNNNDSSRVNTARSISSMKSASTSIFITRTKNDKDSTNQVVTSRSQLSTRESTPRESFNDDIAIETKASIKTKSKLEPNKNPSEIAVNQRKLPPPTEVLTEDEELRIQELLHEDFDKYISYDNVIYNKAKNDDIDIRLEQYGNSVDEDRMNIIALESELMKENLISFPKSLKNEKDQDDKKSKDYLYELRRDKVLKEYEKKVDDLLNQLKSFEEDFTGILNNELESNAGSESKALSRNSSSKKLLQVPAFKEVSINRRISRGDINQLIRECLDESKTLAEDIDSHLTVDNSNNASNETSEELHNKSLADRLTNRRNEINQLLSNFRRECSQLAEMRKKNILEQLQSSTDSEVYNHEDDDSKTEWDDGAFTATTISSELPSSQDFEKRELEILKKLVDKTELLKLPPIPGLRGSEQFDARVLAAAGGSKSQIAVDADSFNRSVSKLFRNRSKS